ncbi:hypothetical protein D3C86_2120660 [compost metagenome]
MGDRLHGLTCLVTHPWLAAFDVGFLETGYREVDLHLISIHVQLHPIDADCVAHLPPPYEPWAER